MNQSQSIWYPPAETKIPFSVFKGILQQSVSVSEKGLSEYFSGTDCVIGSNGRTLLFQLLQALAKQSDNKRSEVLIPAFTCYSIPAAVVKANLTLRFYDMHPNTFAPDIDSLQRGIGNHTLAVISQHLLGIPTDTGAIGRIAADAGAWHIEDAAQALGGALKGVPLGKAGDFGLLSFGRGKPLPLGGGGALISIRHNLHAMVPRAKQSLGWKPLLMSTVTQVASNPRLYRIAEKLPLGLGRTIFDPDFHIDKTSTVLTGMIGPMLNNLRSANDHRCNIASAYRKRLHPLRCVNLPAGGDPVYPRYPVLAKPDKIPTILHRLGVRRLYPKALHQEPSIAAYSNGEKASFPGAEKLARDLVTLPTHHTIKENIANEIVSLMVQWLNEKRPGQVPSHDP